jgi:hypothetical protein
LKVYNQITAYAIAFLARAYTEPRLRKFHYVTKRRIMASAEREPIMGVWGLCPQWGPGAKPLVRGSGGRSPPEADEIS